MVETPKGVMEMNVKEKRWGKVLTKILVFIIIGVLIYAVSYQISRKLSYEEAKRQYYQQQSAEGV